MEDLGLLDVQKVHALGDVKCHFKSLLHRQLNLLFFMQQREDCAAEAKLSQDEHIASLAVSASAHEIDQVGVSDLDQSRNLPLKLFRQVVLPHVLSIVRKFQLFHSNIVFFVCRFEHISRRACTDLFFKSDVTEIDPEVLLALLELLDQDVTGLLSLRGLIRVSSWAVTDSTSIIK